jgi:hypothetical protein
MVNTKQRIEVLALDAGRPGSSTAGPPAELTRHERVQGLLDLAEQLQGVLVPVEADTRFRRQLHGNLVLEAQGRQAKREGGLVLQHRTGILIGAAAIGSAASLAGVVVAYLLRHRHSRVTHIVTS